MSNPQGGFWQREMSFQAWRGVPTVMRGAHVHTDIELNLFLDGAVGRYLLAGRFHDVMPGRLTVFWAGMPHRLCQISPDTEFFCMTLPLGWFLSWSIGGRLRDCLLNGELIQAQLPDAGRVPDTALFSGWAADMATGSIEMRRIVLLEVEARLARLAHEVEARHIMIAPIPAHRSKQGDEGRSMKEMAGFLNRCYCDPIRVADVAGAAGLNPNYAATVFKLNSGLSIWQYLTRLRVSHAQRLLLTTDWTVERIALDCGFGSPSRFFAAFRQRCGCTPREYRLRNDYTVTHRQ